jgi:hypothetical protein
VPAAVHPCGRRGGGSLGRGRRRRGGGGGGGACVSGAARAGCYWLPLGGLGLSLTTGPSCGRQRFCRCRRARQSAEE